MTLMMEAKRRNAKSGAAYSEREGALVRMLKNDTPVGKMPGGKMQNGNEREKHSMKLHIRSRNGIRTEDLSGADLIRAGRDEASRVLSPADTVPENSLKYSPGRTAIISGISEGPIRLS